MTQPLAIVLYEKLLPGTQLVNRLQDMKYRVQALTDPQALVTWARQEKPIIVLADLVSTRQSVIRAIAQLRQDQDTKHIPVIAFAPDDSSGSLAEAREAGASQVASDTAILNHLTQLLEQALTIE